MNTNLEIYDNSWYKPGSILKQLLWYIVSILFFKGSWNVMSSVKVFWLRFFGAQVGYGVVIKPNVKIKYPWKLIIGNHCWIGEYVWIDNLDQVILGNHVCLSQGAFVFGVCNVVGSSISRETHAGAYTHAGPEIGVASTKAFMGQMLVLYILVLKLGILRQDLDKDLYLNKIKDLKTLPKLVEQTLLTESKIQTVSSSFTDAKGSMFLGRGFSYPIALEGALKLKELAYVHAEGYPAGAAGSGQISRCNQGQEARRVFLGRWRADRGRDRTCRDARHRNRLAAGTLSRTAWQFRRSSNP